MPSPPAKGLHSDAGVAMRRPPLIRLSNLVGSRRSPLRVFTTKPAIWLEFSTGTSVTSRTLPARAPVLSITGAPIRSESAREGIAVNIFDAFENVQRIRTGDEGGWHRFIPRLFLCRSMKISKALVTSSVSSTERDLAVPAAQPPLCADGAPARLPLVFQFSNIVRQARALGQPVLFQPPVHTSSFSAAKQKASKKGTSTLFRCQLQASPLEPNRPALPRNILQTIPKSGTAQWSCRRI